MNDKKYKLYKINYYERQKAGSDNNSNQEIITPENTMPMSNPIEVTKEANIPTPDSIVNTKTENVSQEQIIPFNSQTNNEIELDDKNKRFIQLKDDYDKQGYNNESEELLVNYKNAFNIFESEFEI